MKYYVIGIFAVLVSMGTIVFAVDTPVHKSDYGYECFNLEIARAHLDQALHNRNFREIVQARASINNWKKFCPVDKLDTI